MDTTLLEQFLEGMHDELIRAKAARNEVESLAQMGKAERRHWLKLARGMERLRETARLALGEWEIIHERDDLNERIASERKAQEEAR